MNVRRVAAIVVLLASAGALGACDAGDPVNDGGPGPVTTPTTGEGPAPTTGPAPDCGGVEDVASIAPSAFPDSPYVDEIRARGRLRAAVSADTLLFGFRNPLSGELEGFDIDIVREIAFEIFGDRNAVDFKVVTYAQRIPALDNNEVDIVADVMTINCARWQQIYFSSQYYDAGQKVLVRTAETAEDIEGLAGTKMCVADGSTNLEELNNNPRYESIEAVVVPDISDCLVAFQQGVVDSITGDDTVLAGFVTQDPYAKILPEKLTSEPYGLGIKQDHPDFVAYVNRVLERIRRDLWRDWYIRWLEPEPGDPIPDPPPAVYGRPLAP